MKIAPQQKVLLKRIVEETLYLEGDRKLQTIQPLKLSTFNGCHKNSVISMVNKGLVTLTTHEGEEATVATERGYVATFVRDGVAMITRGEA